MNFLNRPKLAPVAGAVLLAMCGLALASSHREAPAIGFDPAADNTDTWAWVNDGAHDTPAAFEQGATTHEGSWWPYLAQWLAARSDAERAGTLVCVPMG